MSNVCPWAPASVVRVSPRSAPGTHETADAKDTKTDAAGDHRVDSTGSGSALSPRETSIGARRETSPAATESRKGIFAHTGLAIALFVTLGLLVAAVALTLWSAARARHTELG